MQPVLPCKSAHVHVGEIVLQRRRLLGPGVLRPHTVRAPKIGDAGISGNARAGQHRDLACRVDPTAGPLEIGADHQHILTQRFRLADLVAHLCDGSPVSLIARFAHHPEGGLDGKRTIGNPNDRAAVDGRAMARPCRRLDRLRGAVTIRRAVLAERARSDRDVDTPPARTRIRPLPARLRARPGRDGQRPRPVVHDRHGQRVHALVEQMRVVRRLATDRRRSCRTASSSTGGQPASHADAAAPTPGPPAVEPPDTTDLLRRPRTRPGVGGGNGGDGRRTGRGGASVAGPRRGARSGDRGDRNCDRPGVLARRRLIPRQRNRLASGRLETAAYPNDYTEASSGGEPQPDRRRNRPGADPLLRRALRFPLSSPAWSIAIAVAIAMLLVARVTPALVADAAADRAFRTDAATPTTPGRGLDIRASVGGLAETDAIDQIAKLIDDLPSWATPQVSASPLYPYTDPRNPTPVIRTKDGQHQATAVVYSRGDANTSLVPAPGTTPVATGDEPGVWVPDTVAAELGVTSGDAVDVAIVVRDPSPDEIAKAGGVPVRVAGVYQTSHGLPVSHSVDWKAIAASLPHDPLDTSKRAALLITDTDTAVPVITGMGDRSFVVWDAPWRASINLEQARIGAAAWRTLNNQLHDNNTHPGQVTAVAHVEPVTLSSSVDIFVAHAEESGAALEPLVSSIGFAAQIISLAVLGTMLWLLVRSRRTEHLAALRMGVHPARIGINGMVEQVGAILAAVLAVYAVVSWAPNLLADAGSFGPHTLAAARHAVLWTLPWLIGFVVFAVTAAVWPLEPTTNGGTGI